MAIHSIDTKWENNHYMTLNGLFPFKSEKKHLNTKWENNWDPKLICVHQLQIKNLKYLIKSDVP